MEPEIKILIAEHDSVDLELLENELQGSGLAYISRIVQNEVEYRDALPSFLPDVILADFTFPSFDGPTALKIREELTPDTPFIFVSGTIGEERSIELIKTGVTDYVLKDKLFTLNHKLRRALAESKSSKEKKQKEKELLQSERRLAMAQQMAHMGNWEVDFATMHISCSDEIFRLFGLPPGSTPQSWEFALSFIHSHDIERVQKRIVEAKQTLQDFSMNFRIRRRNGNVRDVYSEGKVEFNPAGEATGFYGIALDVTETISLENKLAKERLITQRKITHAVLTALENERAHIGHELNENLSQILATSKMYIQLSVKQENCQAYLDMAMGFIQDAMTGIKRISKALIIPDTHIISLTDNIKNLIYDLSLLHPLNIEFHRGDIKANLLGEKMQLNIFRIVQEQLNNILIHSNATAAHIRFGRLKTGMVLSISDNGEGCDILKATGGVGIINIKTRAELYDGRVDIISSPGNGYELIVQLAVTPQPKERRRLKKNALGGGLEI